MAEKRPAPPRRRQTRPDEVQLAVVVAAVQRRTTVPVLTDEADLDLDLGVDLHVGDRQRIELAGELAELAQLPGADDDDVNATVIASLAGCATVLALFHQLLDHQGAALD